MADGLLGRWCRRPKVPVQERVGPLVVFDLDYVDGALFLVVANTGDETAFDVRVAFDDALPGLGGELDLAGLPVFSGLPLLRPGREIRLFCEAGAAVARIGRIVATVRWRTPAGVAGSGRYEHDTALFRQWPQLVCQDDGPAD